MNMTILLFALLSQTNYIYDQTSTNDVYHRGEHQLLGAISTVITFDAYPNAGPEMPLYLSFTLDHGATLQTTLVDQTSDDPRLSIPVNLALEVRGNERDLATLNIAPDAVSIVRWVAGEDTIWIRIQQATSSWLVVDERLSAPTGNSLVQFSIGISARSSSQNNNQGYSNLPYNSRGNEPVDTRDAVSTLICVDLSQSTLDTDGPSALLSYAPTYYGADARVSPGVYRRTQPLDLPKITNGNIGRGKTIYTDVDQTLEEPSVELSFQDGLLRSDIQLTLDLRDPGASVLNTISIAYEVSGAAGFEASIGNFPVAVDPQSAVTLNGETYYQRAVGSYWVRDERELVSRSLRLFVDGDGFQGEARLSWSIFHGSIESGLDDAPFDGPDQMRSCGPYQVETQASGSFSLAGKSRGIPHITRQEGTFSSQIMLLNPGDTPEPYLITGYDAQGNAVGTLSGVLGAGSRILEAPETLFDTYPDHLAVAPGSKVRTAVIYRALGEDKAPVHVFDTDQTATEWRIDARASDLTYDGLALVNKGAEATTVTLTHYNADGTKVAETQLHEALAPRQKLLHILELDNPEPGTWFRISATQPIMLAALRGDRTSNYIWENKPAQIPPTTQEEEAQ